MLQQLKSKICWVNIKMAESQPRISDGNAIWIQVVRFLTKNTPPGSNYISYLSLYSRVNGAVMYRRGWGWGGRVILLADQGEYLRDGEFRMGTENTCWTHGAAGGIVWRCEASPPWRTELSWKYSWHYKVNAMI